MKWFWHVSRANEIFLDLDSERAVWYARDRLERNNGPRHLGPVDAVYLYRSQTPGHFHMIVRVPREMRGIERAAWALYLGSDKMRALYIQMRIDRMKEGIMRDLGLGADFLITPKPHGFRKPDFYCRCEEKHKDKRITAHCPVMLELLGKEASAEYFAVQPKAERLVFGELPQFSTKGRKVHGETKKRT